MAGWHFVPAKDINAQRPMYRVGIEVLGVERWALSVTFFSLG